MNPQYLSSGHTPNDSTTNCTYAVVFVAAAITIPIGWFSGTLSPWLPAVFLVFTAYLAWELRGTLYSLEDIHFDQKGVLGMRGSTPIHIPYKDMEHVTVREGKRSTRFKIRYHRKPDVTTHLYFSVWRARQSKELTAFKKQLRSHNVTLISR